MHAITCRGLGKAYSNTGRRGGYRTLRESLSDALAGRRLAAAEVRWVLRGIDLDIPQGSVVGLIGANGAGKSTFLKILSQITPPSEGEVRMSGRVGSLLEVGTGFHPELTGRENVYLAGSIIGMRRDEIHARFDEIVSFAEAGPHIDNPVKHYSSGMFARLAFAVAAHLDAEILLVDEVLAVGDARFQSRCLGKMHDITASGRTVVFVSHHMGSIRRLCPQTIWLDRGRLRGFGPTAEMVDHYLGEHAASFSTSDSTPPADDVIAWHGMDIIQDGRLVGEVFNGDDIIIALRFALLRPQAGFRVFIDLCGDDQELIMRSLHDEREGEAPRLEPGELVLRVRIPADTLADRPHWIVAQATVFNERMLAGPLSRRLEVHRSTRINAGYPDEPIRGRVLPNLRWSCESP